MRGLRQVGTVVAWFVIAAVVAVLAVAVLVPRLGGATPYTILTGSMQPDLPPGTLVVAKPVDPEALGVGDVITYQLRSGRPEVVTHRVVEQGVRPDGERIFRTQGDANDVADATWVREVQIRGRLWYSVPLLGHVHSLLSRSQHEAVVFAVAGLLALYACLMFASAARDRFRERRSGRMDG